MPNDMPIKTYADLLTALHTLTPEQLAQEVRWWGDERGGCIVSVDVLECEYGNVSGDGHEPITVYTSDPEAWAESSDIMPAGTVLLQDCAPGSEENER